MINLILLILCAVIFYKAGDMEGASCGLWAALSVGVYALTWLVFGWGFLLCFLGQVGLFVGITIFKMLRSSSIG